MRILPAKLCVWAQVGSCAHVGASVLKYQNYDIVLCVNELIYALTMFVFVVSMLFFVLGWLRPALFTFLGSHATRLHIAIYSLGMILISSVISGSFEPAAIKQARSDRENRSTASEVQKTASELKEQRTMEYNEIVPTQSTETEDKTPVPQPPTPQTDLKYPESNQASGANPETILDFRREVVKKSRSNKVCYAPGAANYNRIINYKAYKTVGECLKSGGRLPS